MRGPLRKMTVMVKRLTSTRKGKDHAVALRMVTDHPLTDAEMISFTEDQKVFGK